VTAARPGRQFHPGLPIAFALLIGGAILLAGWAARNKPPAPASPAGAALNSQELRFADNPDGTVSVYLDESNELVDVLETGGSSFVRGVLRAMARERRQRGISREEPFRIIQLSANRLLLEDPSTGTQIPLEAFGPDNVAAFQRLMTAANKTHGGARTQ
jgi:putative photosynthetic complex assembly protein